jgi:hypothetical protein
MRGMATVASFLDDVASFAEGGANLLRNTEIFAMSTHPIPPNGVAALLKLLHLFLMALPTFFRKDHGLLFRGSLMVDVAGHTMDSFFCMF